MARISASTFQRVIGYVNKQSLPVQQLPRRGGCPRFRLAPSARREGLLVPGAPGFRSVSGERSDGQPGPRIIKRTPAALVNVSHDYQPIWAIRLRIIAL